MSDTFTIVLDGVAYDVLISGAERGARISGLRIKTYATSCRNGWKLYREGDDRKEIGDASSIDLADGLPLVFHTVPTAYTSRPGDAT